LRWHIAAGLKVFATPSAAATINDNLERVAAIGVIISEEVPAHAEIIETGDIDILALRQAFHTFDIELPINMAVAVQDHGYSPEKSNRLVRFEHLADAIRSGGNLEAFAYNEPPPMMTRMIAVRDCIVRDGFRPLLMDTGPAAIFGASLDPCCLEPAIIINFGNGHTVAALLDEGKITAVFEHHTSQLDPEKLRSLVEKLCDGTLKNSEVFEDGGHGAYVKNVPDTIRSTLVTGPRREMFLASKVLDNAKAASPGGDMMITGCIGLIEAWNKREDLWR
jgi:uncharacterized protein (DUF1786 family)